MKNKMGLVVLCGFALCFLSSPSFADDPVGAPVITKLSRNAALNDMVLEIYGKNFGSDASKVRVTIDGKPCMLTFVSDSTIMLLTPSQAKIGKTTLLLTVNNKKANPFAIEILDRSKLGEDFWKRETERMEKSAREDEEKRDEELLTLTSLTTKAHEGGRYFVVVQGKTKELFDDCRVQVQIGFMGQTMGKKYCKITASQFSCLFGPFRKDLFPGLYEVNARFLLHRQRYEVRSQWKKEISKERTKKLAKISNRAYYNVGGKALALSKTMEVMKSRQETLEKLELQLKDFQDVYASATRCYFRVNRKIDEKNWRQWLQNARFVRNNEDWERIRKEKRAIRGDVHLDAVKWQKYISKQLTDMRRLYSEFDSSRTTFLSPRLPEVNTSLTQMFAVLFDLYLKRTVALYKENKLRIPSDLASQFGTMPFDQTPFTGTGRFKALQRKIMQRFEEEMLAFESEQRPKEPEPKKP